MHIFPEIDLKDKLFHFMASMFFAFPFPSFSFCFSSYFFFLLTCFLGNFWNDTKNRRRFFEDIAKEHGFDPLTPDSWYKFPYSKVIAKKVYIIPLSLAPHPYTSFVLFIP